MRHIVDEFIRVAMAFLKSLFSKQTAEMFHLTGER